MRPCCPVGTPAPCSHHHPQSEVPSPSPALAGHSCPWAQLAQGGPSVPEGHVPSLGLTLHLHDLVRVLDYFVLGLVPEGMRPGLDQVQDLVSDVHFYLPLQRRTKSIRRALGHAGGKETSWREEVAAKTPLLQPGEEGPSKKAWAPCADHCPGPALLTEPHSLRTNSGKTGGPPRPKLPKFHYSVTAFFPPAPREPDWPQNSLGLQPTLAKPTPRFNTQDQLGLRLANRCVVAGHLLVTAGLGWWRQLDQEKPQM